MKKNILLYKIIKLLIKENYKIFLKIDKKFLK